MFTGTKSTDVVRRNMNIGFLGAGNMGGAILNGYSHMAAQKGEKLFAVGRDRDKLNKVLQNTGAVICENIKELIEMSDVFFICVKPKDYEIVLQDVKRYYTMDKICISMAAGISIGYIKKHLGNDSKVVRIMPNTPASLGVGATSISFDENISNDEKQKITDILMEVGIVQEISEKDIHSVIGLSGSSPAYAYMYMRALIESAVKEGMDEKAAKKLAAHSLIGAAHMVLNHDGKIEELINSVCSPNGTTIEAVNVLREKNFEGIVSLGFDAAFKRSKEMEI